MQTRALVLGGLAGGGLVVGVERREGGEADEEARGAVLPRVVQHRVPSPRVAVLEGVLIHGHGVRLAVSDGGV